MPRLPFPRAMEVQYVFVIIPTQSSGRHLISTAMYLRLFLKYKGDRSPQSVIDTHHVREVEVPSKISRMLGRVHSVRTACAGEEREERVSA